MSLEADSPSDPRPPSPSQRLMKAIIERDYTDKSKVRFLEACPVRLNPLVNPEVVINTVRQINSILEELTVYGGPRQILENLISFCTLYMANPLLPHGSKACLDRLTQFIEKENSQVYGPLGIKLENPVEYSLLQIEFHAALLTGDATISSQIDTEALFDYAFDLVGDVISKRNALEILIQSSTSGNTSLSKDLTGKAADYIGKNIMGSADYEYRLLMGQLFYNLKRDPLVSNALKQSPLWKGLLVATSKSFQRTINLIVLRPNDVHSLQITEIRYDSKLYCTGPNGQHDITAYFNCASITVNVGDPINSDTVLIEILYESIESLSACLEDALQDKGLILNLRGSHRCIIGFSDTDGILQAEKLIEQRSASNFMKKSSSSICELQSHDPMADNPASEHTEINEMPLLITPPPTSAKLVPKTVTSLHYGGNMVPQVPSYGPLYPYIEKQVSKIASTRTRVVSKVRKVLAKRLQKSRPIMFKLACKYSSSLLRASLKWTPPEESQAWEVLAPNFPTLPERPATTQ